MGTECVQQLTAIEKPSVQCVATSGECDRNRAAAATLIDFHATVAFGLTLGAVD